MNTPTLFLSLALSLSLVGCGGAEFSAATEEDGLAGAAGDVDPGTGGSAGVAGSGTGGATAGSAGAGSAGSAGSGAAGAGGEPSGGAAGSGPTEPTCTPEEAITTAALPESFTWGGFDGFWEGEDQDYCAYSDGGTCTLSNRTLAFSADDTVSLGVYVSCEASFAAGPCGAEVACAATVDPNRQASLTLSVEPAGNGYRLLHISGPGALILNASECNVEMPSGSSAPTSDAAQPALAAEFIALIARTYPCP